MPREAPVLAAGLLWLCSGSAGAQVAESKGGYASSIKQAFEEDVNKLVVWGHFDQGSPPNIHRYYCLIDPKTGKTEPNGVAGELTKRRDGMTGLNNPAVAPLSCEDAQQKGLLVTSGYSVHGPGIHSVVPAAASTPAAASPTAAGAAAGSPASAPGATPAQPGGAMPAAVVGASAATAAAAGMAAAPARAPLSAPDAAAGSSLQTEIMAVYARFIFGQNSHDRAAVADVLLDSKDFVWERTGREPVWGYTQALDTFQQEWQGAWRLDPQLSQLKVASPAPGIAVLVTPLLVTSGHTASPVPARWSGVFVRTDAGWRIAAIFLASTEAARGK